jgi:ribonuclease R
LDGIDRTARRLQFALVPSAAPQGEAPRSLRKTKAVKPEHTSPTRTGKPAKAKSKARDRNKKAKGKRR